jgi:type I restriction enzyme S subunit
MIWTAPSEKDSDNATREKRFWDAAEQAMSAPHFAETCFTARPVVDETDSLGVEIQNLRRTRDLLLPRLLSGQVELKTKAA